MKQYILSILCLLATLVQPATAQTSLSTKAAPAEPVMPYVVTITQPTSGDTANLLTATTEMKYNEVDDLDLSTLTGDATLTFEDRKWAYQIGTEGTLTPFTGTIKGSTPHTLTLVGNEGALTLADGTSVASITATATATAVKLNVVKGGRATKTAITLNVAKGGRATVNGLTSDSNSSLNVSPANATNGRLLVCTSTALSDNNIRGLMQWTWGAIPASPIAVYTPLEEHLITFADNSKTSSYATNISFATSVKVQVGDEWQQGTSADNKVVSTFKMPDNGDLTSFTGMVKTKHLSPTDSDSIFIVDENTYKMGINAKAEPFSGTITGDVSVINVSGTVTGNPIIILERVKPKNYQVGDTIRVEKDAEVTLGIKGSENLINAITILPGGAVNVDTVPSGGSLTIAPKIINDGKFWCKTSMISEVVGKASLKIISTSQDTVITAGGTYNLNVGANSDTSDANVTYQWQSYDLTSKAWGNIVNNTSTSLLRAEPTTGSTCATYTTNALGTYRCVVTSTSKDNAAVTTLTTRTAKVTLKPTTYTVTLPYLEGATTFPEAGKHIVNEGTRFNFGLTLKPEYSNSTPIITVANTTLKLRDGIYSIENVTADITVVISDIVKNERPKPTTHTVTLPALIGATLDPGTGKHIVLKNNKFDFTLTLDKDYNQSKVIVSTNRDGKIQVNSDGKYTISRIDRDIIVSIEGIVKNSTVGNAVVDSDENRVWTDGNLLYIHTDAPQVWVYTFNGTLATTINTSGGQCQTHLPAGAYIVLIAGKSYKVVISNH